MKEWFLAKDIAGISGLPSSPNTLAIQTAAERIDAALRSRYRLPLTDVPTSDDGNRP